MIDAQISLVDEDRPKECCYSCVNFSELKEPRALEPEGSIYGYCFKSGTKPHSLNMGKGYAVYVSEGKCREFRRKKP
jgi:hypothetical protein